MLFSVDPGARKGKATCGVAQLDPSKVEFMRAGLPCGELVRAWTIDGTSITEVAMVVREVKAAGGSLIIERQFLGPTGGHFADIEKVITTRVIFVTIATILGVPVEQVYPVTWQTILGIVPATDKTTKISSAGRRIRATKPSAEWLAASLYPGIVLGTHERDAALMGRWAIEKRLKA